MRHIRLRLAQLVVGATLLHLASAAATYAQTPNRQGPPRHASFPSVSPDGRRVLFFLDSGGRPQPRVMDADGTNQRTLPPQPIVQTAWFPDGRRLLTVQRTDRTGPRHLVLMNLDGSDPREIPVQGVLAFANPLGDGSSLLVGTDPGPDRRGGMPTLQVRHLDGSVVSTVAMPTVPGQLRALRPSRDGRRLAFIASIRDSADISPHATKSSTLYVMNIDGSGLTAVATFRNLVELPSWSYDGTKIAVQNDLPYPHDATGAPLDWRDVDGHIVVIDVASGATRDLEHLDRKYLDETPDWSPDGHIYVQSNRDGVMEIYRMNADGSNPQRLTK
jgi:Tol biopolymer transport system component